MEADGQTSCMMESKAVWKVSERSNLGNLVQALMCLTALMASIVPVQVQVVPSKARSGRKRWMAMAVLKSWSVM